MRRCEFGPKGNTGSDDASEASLSLLSQYRMNETYPGEGIR